MNTTTPLQRVRDLTHDIREAASALIDQVRGQGDTEDVADGPPQVVREAREKVQTVAQDAAQDAEKTARETVKKVQRSEAAGKAGEAVAGAQALASKALASKAEASNAQAWHVVPDDGGWALEAEGDTSFRRQSFSTKAHAVRAGRTAARTAEGRLVIHRADGTIQKHHRYDS